MIHFVKELITYILADNVNSSKSIARNTDSFQCFFYFSNISSILGFVKDTGTEMSPENELVYHLLIFNYCILIVTFYFLIWFDIDIIFSKQLKIIK